MRRELGQQRLLADCEAPSAATRGVKITCSVLMYRRCRVLACARGLCVVTTLHSKRSHGHLPSGRERDAPHGLVFRFTIFARAPPFSHHAHRDRKKAQQQHAHDRSSDHRRQGVVGRRGRW